MKNVILKLVLFISLFITFGLSKTNATHNSASHQKSILNELSINIAEDLYRLDKNNLKNKIKYFVENHKEIKALEIIESIENKSYFQFFRQKDILVFNKPIPSNDDDLDFIKKSINHNNENIGTILVYFKDLETVEPKTDTNIESLLDTISLGSSDHLYNYNIDGFKQLFKNILITNNKVKGLLVTDSSDNSKFFQAFNQNDIIKTQVEFPSTFNNLVLKKKNILYENKVIGQLHIYMEANISSNIILTKDEINWIKKNPAVNVIKFFDEPPFTINKDKKEGYLYELLDYSLNSVGLKTNYINGINTYSNMLEAIENGDADVLTSYPSSFDAGKDSNIKKSNPIISTSFVLIGKSFSSDIKSIDDVFGKKVAVVEGYLQDKYLSKFPAIKKVHVNNSTEGFKLVKEGKVDYYINNRANTEYMLAKSFSTNLQIKYELPYSLFPPLSLSFAMNGKNEKLVSILNKAIDQMPYKKIKELKDRWIVKSNQKLIPLSEEERVWIKNNPVIKVHNEINWPPFNFNKNGKPMGFSIDYMNLISSKLNIKVKYITGKWNELLDKAYNQELDVMLNIVKTKKREEHLLYVDSYTNILTGIVVRENESNLSSMEALKGKRVSVIKGFFYESLLKNEYPEVKIVLVDTAVDALKAVLYGKADATLGKVPVINYMMQENGIIGLKFSGDFNTGDKETQKLNIAVRNDAPILQSILKKTMQSLDEEEIFTIKNRWLSSSLNLNNPKEVIRNINFSKEEIQWINKNQTISFTADPNWLPYEAFDENGNYIGIAADYLKMLQDSVNLNIEKVISKDWDDAVNLAMNEKVDVISGVIGEKFSDKYASIKPYLNNKIVILMDKETSAIDKPTEALKNKKIAIIKDYGYVTEVYKKYPSLDFIEVQNVQEGISGVATGKYDAMFASVAILGYTMNQMGISDLKIVGDTNIEMKLTLYIKKEHKELYSIISKVYDTFKTKEENTILNKWFSSAPKINKSNYANNLLKEKDLELSDILPIKEMLVGLVLFLIIFYLIWKYQIKSNNKDLALKTPLFVIIGLFLFFASAITIITLQNIEISQKNKVKESIKAVLDSSSSTMNLWLDAQFRRLDLISKSDGLVSNVIKSNTDNNNKLLLEHFEKNTKVFEAAKFILLDEKLNILVSNYTKKVDLIKDDIAKSKSLSKKSFLIAPQKHETRIQDKLLFVKNITIGKIKSYLVMTIDTTDQFVKILQASRFGKSGETYAFNGNLDLISNSRFDKDLREKNILKENEKSFLNIKIKNFYKDANLLEEKKANQTSGFNVEGYPDYRGNTVFGVWKWDENLNIGLVSEVDEYEVMRDFYNMKKTITIIVFLIIVFTIFLTILVAWISTNSRKSLEKANKDLNKLLNSFNENVISSRSDLEGNIIYANHAFSKISGYEIDELIGQPHSLVRHPDMEKEVFKDLWETIQSGNIWRGEVKNRKKDGGFYWVDVVITPQFDDKGNIFEYSAIRQDITSKKEVEELSSNLEIKVEERTSELQASQEQFSTMVSNIPGVIYRCLLDEHWSMLFISNEIEELSGYPVSDYINNEVRTFADIMHPDDLEPTSKEIISRIENDEPYYVDYRIITKDGVVKWVSAKGKAVYSEDGQVGWLDGAIFDITEQKNLQLQIKQNQEQMTFVSQYANLGFWNFNPQVGDLFVNDTFVQMLGYDANEVLEPGYENEMFKPFKDGLAFWEQLLHPDDAKLTGELISAHINGETDLYKVEYRMRKADGSWMWSMAIGRIAEYDKNGKPIKFNGVNIDIQDAKDAQDEIENNRLFLDTLLDSQDQIIITTDGEKLISTNKSFLEFFAVSSMEEFIENTGECICDKFDTKAPFGYLQIMMGEEMWIDYIINNSSKIHKTIINIDGISYTFSVTGAILPGEDNLKSAVFTNITELENSREKIEAINKHTQDSIEYASLIQHSIIPTSNLFKNYFDDYLNIWLPKDIVGGDIYLFEELRDKDECLLMVIDCTGHGVPGAFVTMLVKAIERQIVAIIASQPTREVSPAWILSYFNQTMKKLLRQEDEDAISNAGFDAGIIYYNKKQNLLRFAGAEIALFYVEENEVKRIRGNRHSIGYKKSNIDYVFTDHDIKVYEGLKFYMTTDGYLDQNGGSKGFPLSRKRFTGIIEENHNESFADQQEILLDTLQEYQGSEDRNDDITMLGFKIGKSSTKEESKIINWEI